MRTLRAQKVTKPLRGITLDENATFSVFEDFTPKTVTGEQPEGYTMFPVYDGEIGDQQLGAEGVEAVKQFSEKLSNKRYNCMQGDDGAFDLELLVQKDGEKYQVIKFHFAKKDNQGVADLVVEQQDKVNGKTVLRKIVGMLVDSDTNESLTRFVAAQEWEATTYAILDANVNLGIYKNVHLTLNTPFNCNMKWYVPNRKLVYGYKFSE